MTTRTIDLDAAQHQLPQLVEEALRGDEVIITRGEEPVAKLVPYVHTRRKPQIGSAKGLILFMADDFNETPEDFAEYMP
ncbi:MAG: type II toxin-antitoxin system prevent-host-death family antitoxin [Chloroflexi bacterium]|nr:type II toxin-antitoxin system prevent-host-death family antitoxin [Chloroflexota bacterium]